jgi:PKD repeat protein
MDRMSLMAARCIAFLVLIFALLAGTVSGSPAGSDFTVSPASPTEGQEATFTFAPAPGIVGTPTVEWDIVGNDNFEATGTVATHTYDDDGSRTVRMRVTDTEGSEVVAKTFSVNAAPNDPPTVDFSFLPASPLPGNSVSFSATGSDPDGDDLTYAWTFGDGGTSTAEDPQHTYASPGTRTVTVTVTDEHGATDTESKQITVQNRRPTVDFDFSPASPLPGENVLFSPDVSDPDGDAVTLSWNFGVGSTKTGTNSAKYASPGTRTVTLTATDSRGGSTAETREITVRDPAGPTPGFTVSPAIPLVGQAIVFTNTSVPAAGRQLTTAEWDLDNDGEFDDSPAGWSFATPGNYTLALRVTQDNANQAVSEKTIRVNAPPSAGFVWSPLEPVAGQAVDLFSVSSDSEGALAAQAWDLDGDGEFDDATGSSVRQVFPRPGTYDVGLHITDSDGAVSTVRRPVTIAAAPVRSAELRFITPFPVVRLAWKVLSHGARVQVLGVRAPRGSLIRVKCGGKGCPVRAVRRTSRGRGVRFAQFERRLRAGISLELFIRKPGMIGKYTRFRIRAGAPPKRVDLCLFPTRRSPGRCP